MLTGDRIQITPADAAVQALPAGGSDPSRFDCTEAWYPVSYLDDLDRAKPTRFTLLGRDLVLWWDRASAAWCAFDDRCPHRLVPLSQGRIAEDGLLECPYHGWAFKGDGTCDRIPQTPAGDRAHTSKRACATSLPTAERQGLLFVYAGSPDRASHVKIPIIEPLEDSPEGWICLNTVRDLPYDALTLLENVLDASHVPFTHHRSVGNRANAAPVDLEVVETGKQGFVGTWAEGPRKGQLGRQDTTFIAPALMWHDLTSKQFGRTLTVVYATPTRKGECRLFARFPFKFSSKLPAFLIKLTPSWYSHLGQNSILEEDQIFLHLQERVLEAKGGSANLAKACYLPTHADDFVSQLRQWVTQFDADPFPGEPLPPALPTPVLMDRYHSHTVHCASCRTALANIKRVRLGLAIAGAIAWSSLPILTLFFSQLASALTLFAAAFPLVAGALWLWLGRLEQQFYKGRDTPSRNLPEQKK